MRKNLSKIEEYKLIQSYKKGNIKALKKIYDLYANEMYNISLRLVKSKEDAEDIIQEVFTDAFKNITEFRFDSTLGYWLKKITINKSINLLKRKNVKLIYVENPENNYEDISDNQDFLFDEYDEEQKANLIKAIKEALNELPDGYRLIFSLYLLEGYNHQEIAKILDISESTSKTQYLRAKKKIKEILKKKGYGKI